MYDCILFDFDGTVFDTVEGITKSVRYALNKVGIDAELESLRCFAGPPLVDKFMEVYGFDRAAAEQATLDFRERYNPIGLNECCVFPGIKELLEKLHAAGKTVGLATSKPQDFFCPPDDFSIFINKIHARIRSSRIKINLKHFASKNSITSKAPFRQHLKGSI